MKKVLLPALLSLSINLFAQNPADVVNYSFYPQNGSARNIAIGGAMGSLGGDISATYVNPAGLGFYRTGEFVFTPGFLLNKNKSLYRESTTKDSKNTFGLGPVGFVLGNGIRHAPKAAQAVSIGLMQTASFNNSYRYSGYNNYSSYTEMWAEEAGKSGYTGTSDEIINQIIRDPQYSLTAGLGLYTYLVDGYKDPNSSNYMFKGRPEFLLDSGQAIYQENKVDTKGGIYELALGYGYTGNEKWYFGGTLGIPIISYQRDIAYSEKDTSSNTGNGFGYFNYNEHLKTNGAGFNLKLGAIYRPQEYIRLGFAIHSPSIYFLTDTRSASLEAETENYNQYAKITSGELNNGLNAKTKYQLLSPWKLIFSGSYVFREVQDVKKQKGFISADIEYLYHKGSTFYSNADQPTADDKAYYKSLTRIVRNDFKGAFNFRLGGELKFNTIMGRLGFAYYGNPYKDNSLKANRMILSGGLGYRHKGVFIDLTYAHSFSKDVNFPYILEDRANTFASLKQQRGNIMATIGFKF
ncbi:MAG: hypothetical protein HYR66_01805 [Sphingobacteriales bacterium]|nr:hypothetical protein [Sphingobacteriales bacterium]MBI3719588.1 hypothetical protein [Sphingobacteriales bacterium]